MALTSTDDLPLMDDLLEWLALAFWTTLMDELEMVQFLSFPSESIDALPCNFGYGNVLFFLLAIC